MRAFDPAGPPLSFNGDADTRVLLLGYPQPLRAYGIDVDDAGSVLLRQAGRPLPPPIVWTRLGHTDDTGLDIGEGAVCMRSIALALMIIAAVPHAALAVAGDLDADGVPDAADAFPCDPALAAVRFVPSESASATLLYEDNWPNRGDLDFNDAVVGYHAAIFHDAAQDVRGLRLVVRPRAVGGNITSGLALRLPVDASAVTRAELALGSAAPSAIAYGPGELVVVLAADLRATFGGQAGIINAETTNVGDGDALTLELSFAPGVRLDAGPDALDLFFFRTTDASHEVHRPQFSGTAAMNTALFGTGDDGSTAGRHFVDTAGLPFLLLLPDDVGWPREEIAIDRVWPSIVTFAASGGADAADFYTSVADPTLLFVGDPAVPPPPVSGACLSRESTVVQRDECFDLETGAVVGAAPPSVLPCGPDGDVVFTRSPFTGRPYIDHNQCADADGRCLTGVEVASSDEAFDDIDASDVPALSFTRSAVPTFIDQRRAVLRTPGGVYKVAFVGTACASGRCEITFRWQPLLGAAPGGPPTGPVRSVRFYTTEYNCFDLDTDTDVPGVDDRPYRCADGTDLFFSSNNGSPASAVLTRNPCTGSDCTGGPLLAPSPEAFEDVDASDLPNLVFTLAPPQSFDRVFVLRTPLGDYKIGPVREGTCSREPGCFVDFLYAPL